MSCFRVFRFAFANVNRREINYIKCTVWPQKKVRAHHPPIPLLGSSWLKKDASTVVGWKTS